MSYQTGQAMGQPKSAEPTALSVVRKQIEEIYSQLDESYVIIDNAITRINGGMASVASLDKNPVPTPVSSLAEIHQSLAKLQTLTEGYRGLANRLSLIG